MKSFNPQFQQSKETFDIMSEIIRDTIKELTYTYNTNFAKLEKTTNKLDKERLLIKLDKLTSLNRTIKDYQASVNNCMEQYYFLYQCEKHTKEEWKKKYNKFKQYASDKGIDTSLLTWL